MPKTSLTGQEGGGVGETAELSSHAFIDVPMFLRIGRCSKCEKECPFPENVDIDLSGTPCVGSSTMGNLKGGNDPSSAAQCF